MDTLMFTPAGVLDLLSKIEELKDFDIGISESLDGESLQLQIGDSVYEIEMETERNLETEESTLMELDDANVEAYESLIDNGFIDEGDEPDMSDRGIDTMEDVESGLIKEIAKTLLIGGMVRLVGKEFKK